MDLIIALVLGMILFTRVMSDKTATKNAKDRFEEEQKKISEWKSLVTDFQLEQRLDRLIKDGNNKAEVRAEILPVYESIFKDKRFIDLYPKEYWCKAKAGWSPEFHEEVQKEICINNSRNALRIMMAKRGKILKFDADSSTIEWLSAESPLTAYILIWCAEEVQRHGAPNKFVVPSIGRYGGGGMHWDVY